MEVFGFETLITVCMRVHLHEYGFLFKPDIFETALGKKESTEHMIH